MDPAATLPQGFECPKCHYDLENAPTRICSECGRRIHRGDLVKHARVLAIRDNIRGRTVKHLAAHTLIAGAMSGSAALLGLDMALVIAVGCGVLIAGSYGVAPLVCRFAAPPKRAAYFGAWLHTHWWLHGPWVCIPFCAVLALIAAVVDRNVGIKDQGPQFLAPTVTIVTLLGFMTWTAWWILCLIFWWIRWRKCSRVLRLGESRAVTLLIALGVLMLCVAGLLGIIAGFAAFAGAHAVAGLWG